MTHRTGAFEGQQARRAKVQLEDTAVTLSGARRGEGDRGLSVAAFAERGVVEGRLVPDPVGVERKPRGDVRVPGDDRGEREARGADATPVVPRVVEVEERLRDLERRFAGLLETDQRERIELAERERLIDLEASRAPLEIRDLHAPQIVAEPFPPRAGPFSGCPNSRTG